MDSYLYIIFWVRIHYYCINFVVQIVSSLTNGSSFSVLLTYPCPCSFSSTSLLSDSIQCSRLILCVSLSSTRIIHVFKEPWLILLEDDIRKRIRVLTMLAATEVSLSPDSHSWQSKKYMCVLSCVCIHIHKYLYMYSSESMVSLTCIHIDVSSSSSLPLASFYLPLACLQQSILTGRAMTSPNCSKLIQY